MKELSELKELKDLQGVYTHDYKIFLRLLREKVAHG